MSLSDRFPFLRNYRSPDWLTNAPDDNRDLAESARDSMFAALDDFDDCLAAKHHYPRCQNENCPNGDTCPFRHCAACGPASRWPCRYAKEQAQ